MLRSDAQFDGLRIVHDGPTSASLIWQGQIIGKASQHNGLAYFDPGVAHEGVRESNVEYIFADWAGAQFAARERKLRRSRVRLRKGMP